jgi:hypothetical protein
MWERGCFPTTILAQPHRPSRPRHPYAVPRTSLQCVCIRRRNCIEQLSPSNEYAPLTFDLPARNRQNYPSHACWQRPSAIRSPRLILSRQKPRRIAGPMAISERFFVAMAVVDFLGPVASALGCGSVERSPPLCLSRVRSHARTAKASLDGSCRCVCIEVRCVERCRTRCLFLFGRTASIGRQLRCQRVGPTIPDHL